MPTTRAQAVRQAIASSSEPVSTTTTTGGLASDTGPVTTSQADAKQQPSNQTRRNLPDEPPRFTINLSLPPEQRYLEVCAALKDDISTLPALFDEVVGGIVHWLPLRYLHFVCRLLLRGIYNREENRELKGISKAIGVPMYLLVCFNVLLDLFMGCSSGGARVSDGHGGTKMMHFRTLDWDMPALRRIVVQLDFVREPGGEVVASSIGYAGFVGVLTGVRRDLSMSLNFRPNRADKGVFWADAKYAWHLVLVLLGWRPSIASVLREYLLGKSDKSHTYETIVQSFRGTGSVKMVQSTPCYLCFCSGHETTVVEKDRITAKVRSSDDFIVITNTDDVAPEPEKADQQNGMFAMSLADIVEESNDRKKCAEFNWRMLHTATAEAMRGDEKAPCSEDVVALVQKYPTMNEMTHFACVLDPVEGKVSWCRRWLKPVSARWVKAHTPEYW